MQTADFRTYAEPKPRIRALRVGPMEAAAGTHGGKRNHEEISDMMALVEAARKVRAATARPCAQGQMGSQCGWRERLWPSSADAGTVKGISEPYTVAGLSRVPA